MWQPDQPCRFDPVVVIRADDFVEFELLTRLELVAGLGLAADGQRAHHAAVLFDRHGFLAAFRALSVQTMSLFREGIICQGCVR